MVINQGGNGGWIPVVHQWRGGGSRGKEVRHGLFTVFVDNLPGSMDAKSLFKLFTKFGIVKDVFIPFKRRKMTNSRFGFAWFDCSVASDIAVQKANGLLVDDRVLEVKHATYDRHTVDAQSRRRPQLFRGAAEPLGSKGKIPFVGHRSFVEVLKGPPTTAAGTASLTINVNEDGHGWLYESVVIRLNSKYSTSSIRDVLKKNGLAQVVVREGGGRDAVLTFSSQAEFKSNIHNIKEWFKDWSQFVLEWRPGVQLDQERCVWLRIRVVTTCMKLINKAINLECKGKLHPILVYEEFLVNPLESDSRMQKGTEDCNSNASFFRVRKVSLPEESYKRKEDDDEVAEGCDMSAAVMTSSNEVAQRKGLTHCCSGENVDTMVEETLCDVEFSRPSAWTLRWSWAGINLEVDLAHPLGVHLVKSPLNLPSKSQHSRPNSISPLPGCNSHVLSKSTGLHTNVDTNGLDIQGLQDQAQVGPPVITLDHLQPIKKPGKMKAQMEGFSRFAKLYGHKATTLAKHSSRIFRPAAVALAHSDISEGESRLHNYLLKEAKATVQQGKNLGINFRGEEDVVLDKIIDLELKDKERLTKDGKDKL
ncbi:hypothetical protein ACSBR2_040244 [Camellia fascicularis]